MADEPEGRVKNVLGWIGAGILLVIIIGVVWFLNSKGIIGKHTKTVGEECTFQGDCISGNCYRHHCQDEGVGDHNLIDGEPCDSDKNCSSNKCVNSRCHPAH